MITYYDADYDKEEIKETLRCIAKHLNEVSSLVEDLASYIHLTEEKDEEDEDYFKYYEE